jgi:hypothetical protein
MCHCRKHDDLGACPRRQSAAFNHTGPTVFVAVAAAATQGRRFEYPVNCADRAPDVASETDAAIWLLAHSNRVAMVVGSPTLLCAMMAAELPEATYRRFC